MLRDLYLQEGYPQPLSALRIGVSLAGVEDDDEVEQETVAERWGLVWDPEEVPVWSNMGGSEGEQDEWR